ncbi:hypothetical protein EXIGLDRAFT_624518 [Exidia glandulosa HHB12029]|uniref:Uncharacterized protein n=1 Tax=Exidia glandulosa HHB12029 TaxID=1314781 RepID=A0A165DD19_EXIGL|nr:hypothetical protein EXIGLDRAFT_624518 [Exidia glandulosa HHB12029]
MMCMKGHSGLYSCRFCKIRGVHIPGARGNALYTPLDRSTHPDAGNPLRYDPYALPLRTHEEMLQQALQVETATKTRAQTLSRDSGINETPILACLPSVRLDMSFPVEFMHLVWLNLIPNLVLLYSGKYKDLPQGSGLYEFAAAVWEQIGKTTAASGSTMPSAFGARVPNLAKDKTYMIAETWCIWALYIAPVVLRGRFVQEKYYNHFMELVRLLRICVQVEITDADVQEIREGFCKWVQKFEKYVLLLLLLLPYKNQPKRKPEFVRKEYFGQLQYIYILPLPALPKYKQREPQTLLLACVTDCAGLSQPNSVGVRYHSGKMGTSQVIDLASVECVIGRVEDRGQVAIIDRSNEFSRVIIPEDDE